MDGGLIKMDAETMIESLRKFRERVLEDLEMGLIDESELVSLYDVLSRLGAEINDTLRLIRRTVRTPIKGEVRGKVVKYVEESGESLEDKLDKIEKDVEELKEVIEEIRQKVSRTYVTEIEKM
jgi:hypothetical protein